MFFIDQVQHGCNSECFYFVCLVTGDIAGSLQTGWYYLLGPSLRQGRQLCEGKLSLHRKENGLLCLVLSRNPPSLLSHLHKRGSLAFATCKYLVGRTVVDSRVNVLCPGKILWEGQAVWETHPGDRLGRPHHSEISDQILWGEKHEVKKRAAEISEQREGVLVLWMFSLWPCREISESMTQNPKGSLLNTTGTVLMLVSY